jgi:hypothetical protein
MDEYLIAQAMIADAPEAVVVGGAGDAVPDAPGYVPS